MSASTRSARVLLDTGPLVALLNPRDQHHGTCVSTLQTIQPPLLTCWPVLTEAAWLLRTSPEAVNRLLDSVSVGLLEILELSPADLPHIGRLFRQYADLAPQLADIALVHLGNREGANVVFTLDRRDFVVYKYKGRTPFRLLPDAS